MQKNHRLRLACGFARSLRNNLSGRPHRPGAEAKDVEANRPLKRQSVVEHSPLVYHRAPILTVNHWHVNRHTLL